METTNRNARFTYNDCKITLKPGQTINHGQSWSTDEGYSYQAETFSYDGENVHLSTAHGGRDCDGPIDYFADFILIGGQFSYIESSQRDYYAESMNY